MTLPRRDFIATVLVGVAGLVYVLWLAGVGPGVRLVAAIALAMGFAASAVAVVPAFTELLHSSKIYLAVTSALGLLATIRHRRMRSRTDTALPAQPRSSRRPRPSALRHT